MTHAVADTLTPLSPPRLIRWRQTGVLALLVATLSACGCVDYSTDRKQFFNDSADADSGDRTRGQIYFDFSDSDTARPYIVDFKRIRSGDNKGYGFSAPVYDNRDSLKTSFTVSKTKQYDWFSGMQVRWEF